MGDNVESLVMDCGSICHSLYHQGSLPEDSITDVLKGLSLESHEELSKLFRDLEITLKKPLLNVKIEFTMMDQIVEVMDTAIMQYTF